MSPINQLQLHSLIYRHLIASVLLSSLIPPALQLHSILLTRLISWQSSWCSTLCTSAHIPSFSGTLILLPLFSSPSQLVLQDLVKATPPAESLPEFPGAPLWVIRQHPMLKTSFCISYFYVFIFLPFTTPSGIDP